MWQDLKARPAKLNNTPERTEARMITLCLPFKLQGGETCTPGLCEMMLDRYTGT